MTTSYNPIQAHLIEMFRYCDSDDSVNELKKLLLAFYAEKVQAEADRLWDEGTLDADAIERILDEHWTIPQSQA